MKLKETIKDLSEVDAALQGFYVQSGDVFVLDVDNSQTQSRIGEFRNNNITLNNQVQILQQQLEAASGLGEQLTLLQTQFKGIDPEVARQLIKDAQDNKDKKLIAEGDIETLVAQRSEAALAEATGSFDEQIQKIQTQLTESVTREGTYKSRLNDVVVDSSLQTAVSKVATVRQGAMQDILARGRSVYVLDDSGNSVPRDAAGKTILGKDGDNPKAMEEWAAELVLEAPYLFEGNAGGGAGGGGGGGGGGDGGGGGPVVKGTIQAGDQDAINANISDIAEGTVVVSSN